MEDRLYKKLEAYGKSDFYPFHMPGHKRNPLTVDGDFPVERDITEINGFDNLHHAEGILREAQCRAAETFGADFSSFVTNGTSTSNKIVMPANLKPGDIVLLSADCHKSIPYSAMLTGAYPIFLETYPLSEHDLYGGIALAQIKAVMLDLKKHGHLD